MGLCSMNTKMKSKKQDEFDEIPIAVETSLALINNYFCTKQTEKAIRALKIIKDYYPNHPAYNVFDKHQPCEYYGADWKGQDLNGRSIEIFCDHGMGDTIMMLRYVKKLKEKYDVKIVLNSLVYDPFKRLFELPSVNYIDEFSKFHVKCNYHTNIMQLPNYFHEGSTTWESILSEDIPEQPLFVLDIKKSIDFYGQKFDFGLKCNSSFESPYYTQKSIYKGRFHKWNYLSLEPDDEWTKFVKKGDILDLLYVIAALPFVVTVDTLTMHLAGTQKKSTIGLLCSNADSRWGTENTTPWYPSLTLYRQIGNNWDTVIEEFEENLELSRNE